MGLTLPTYETATPLKRLVLGLVPKVMYVRQGVSYVILVVKMLFCVSCAKAK